MRRIATTAMSAGAVGLVALVPSSSTAQTITTCPPGVTAPSPYCTTTPPSAQTAFAAQVFERLAETLKSAGYDVLYSANGQVVTLTFPAAGTVTIDYAIRYNANTGKASSAAVKRVVVAKGKLVKKAAGRGKVKIKATSTGKSILKKLKAKDAKLTFASVTTFDPAASGVKNTVKKKKIRNVQP